MMQELTYRLTYAVCYAVSLLPFGVLYALSDAFYLLAYRLARYRIDVVRQNLAHSFPEMSERERRQLERQFYYWLCDYAVETLKLLSISDKAMLRHIEFRGVDLVEQCFREGQSCSAFLGHYCNWEWLSATGLAFAPHAADYSDKAEGQAAQLPPVMGLIYHPLYNKVFDRLFLQLRSKHGGACIPKRDILRHLLTYRKEGRPTLFGYIADQSPWWTNIHLWLDFLHQETPVFTGAERITTKMREAVFYADIERPRRGQYVCTFKLITRTPEQLPEHELTKRFFQLLEQSIRRQPAFYLWTHKRWKRTREAYESHLVMVNGKAVWHEHLEPGDVLAKDATHGADEVDTGATDKQ